MSEPSAPDASFKAIGHDETPGFGRRRILVAGIPVLCAISAPSNLAVELSRSGGQTLVGFIRDRRMNVYSASDRIVSAG